MRRREENASPAKIDTRIDGVDPGDAFDGYVCRGDTELYWLAWVLFGVCRKWLSRMDVGEAVG